MLVASLTQRFHARLQQCLVVCARTNVKPRTSLQQLSLALNHICRNKLPWFRIFFYWRKKKTKTMSSKNNYAQELLMRQLTELKKNPNDSFSVGIGEDGNLFRWEIMIMGPADSLFEGGFFKAEMIFPPDFPNSPPSLRFLSKMWHPNVYPDGKVCISILHPPGEDKFNSQETAEERWRPILGVEAVLVSVLSMLCDPNINSPANIDAGKQLRDDPKEFKRAVRRVVRASQEDM